MLDHDAMTRRGILGAALLLAGAVPAVAADPYPNKFIRLILPFPPGGGTDTLSRIIGQKLSAALGQSVVIDNRPGAAGNIATLLAAKAPPDGYTLLMGFSTALVVNPALYPDLSVKIATDFVPVSLLADAEYVLVVSPSLPVRSVADLIAYAKANPGKLNYSSSGIGGPLHLAGAVFATNTGTDLTHLPFKGGGPAVLAVLSGEAQVVFGSIAATLPNIKAGKLRPLAVTGLVRSPLLPDLPTLDEAGLKGFDVTTWYGVLAPRGTPQPVVTRLHDELVKSLADPDVRNSMAREGLTPIGSEPQVLADRIRDQTAFWAPVVKAAGIKAE